jgi:hypothetical protein
MPNVGAVVGSTETVAVEATPLQVRLPTVYTGVIVYVATWVTVVVLEKLCGVKEPVADIVPEVVYPVPPL